MERGLAHDKIELIHNPPLDLVHEPRGFSPMCGSDAQKCFQILFAGNLGRFQGLESVIEAAHELRDHPFIRFVFLGAGLAKSDLMQSARGLLGKNVMFLPHMSVETTFAAMQQSQLGLICLCRACTATRFPARR